MRHSVKVAILIVGIPLSAPIYAADELLLDEITIRVIENEDSPIDVNDIALPPSGNKPRGPSSQKADEGVSQGNGNGANNASENASGNSAHAAENAANAAENAANAAENAAEAREKAKEAAENGKGKGRGRNK